MAKIKSKKQLNLRIAELKELEAILAQAETEIESIKDEIKEYMGDEEFLDTGDYTIHWTKYSQNRFDSKSFKVEHPEMYDDYTKLIESRRFKID